MYRILFALILSSFALSSYSQSFSSPESVEFDPINNRYIVSNTNAGNLQSVIPGQSPALFTADVSAPYGLAEYNGVVYVCDDGFVKGYSLTTSQSVFSLDLNGNFLNGICSDGNGTLYVTDFSGKKIYSVNIAAQTYATVVANTVSTPNGILFDTQHNRLIFCTWGSSAKLIEVDTMSFSMTTKITTSLSNIDGVVMDGCGNFYISEWGTDKIHKIDSLFGTPTMVFSAGVSNPADIYFNLANDTLAVPNTSTNTVVFFDADFCTVEDTTSHATISETQHMLFDVITLPESIQIIWKTSDINSLASISVMDMSGKLVEQVKLSGNALANNTYAIPTQKWAAGVYVISFNSGNQSLVKKVFINRQ